MLNLFVTASRVLHESKRDDYYNVFSYVYKNLTDYLINHNLLFLSWKLDAYVIEMYKTAFTQEIFEMITNNLLRSLKLMPKSDFGVEKLKALSLISHLRVLNYEGQDPVLDYIIRVSQALKNNILANKDDFDQVIDRFDQDFNKLVLDLVAKTSNEIRVITPTKEQKFILDDTVSSVYVGNLWLFCFLPDSASIKFEERFDLILRLMADAMSIFKIDESDRFQPSSSSTVTSSSFSSENHIYVPPRAFKYLASILK